MSPVAYIEYMRGDDTYVDVFVAPGQIMTYGPYKPKPGACPRCRSTHHHTVGGINRCTTCLYYWPEATQ